ncbi:hypothetical protein ACFW1A_28560, partial [Kitasatospora sp. NPDC058965]|uniref:hypothetical protein n=1 Tax=Kitasatospora sp. NPDC058965 TaxID=3346682 RepID=UPI0036B1D04E
VTPPQEVPSVVVTPPVGAPAAATTPGSVATGHLAPPVTLPLLPTKDLVTGRLEAVGWHPPTADGTPDPRDGRAQGLLRYRVGRPDPDLLTGGHPLHGTVPVPSRVLHVTALLPDTTAGRAREITDALFHRAAGLAVAERADQVLVSTAEPELVHPLGLTELAPQLWHTTTADLADALRSRPEPADLKVGNCESR